MARCSKRLSKTKKPSHKPSSIARRGIAGRVRSTDRYLHQALSRASRKFRRAFPRGFRDETYLEWERNYKWEAHLEWQRALGPDLFRHLVRKEEYRQIARATITIESRTNLLFSFEKMALRDAVASEAGARQFSIGLYHFLHGDKPLNARFQNWVEDLDRLPRRQTRVLTWPITTVFGFLAQPRIHFFFKPMVTREAARKLGVDLPYAPKPSWPIYKALLGFVTRVRSEINILHPRDMIDLQSFLWVQGSDEYPD
jgi:hypothetical protein